MSKSSTIKFLLALAVVFAAPKLCSAAELKFNDKTWPLEVATQQPVNVIDIRNDFSVHDLALSVLSGKMVYEQESMLAPATVTQLEAAAAQINQPPKSARLELDGNWAKEFDPGQLGQALDIYQLRKNILASQKQESFDLPVLISYPQTTLADTNDLGIDALVSEGISDFSGSTKSRIHNVSTGATRFNGVVLAPGEEFSFNKYLGEVDGEHGFLPELVIKADGVKPEFGGGLCQVSSTAFRAAMNAGLDITARRNHSFAVHYYSPQGSDATIYPGVQDMKFVNDTPAHLLVWTRIDIENRKLYFDYYGTKDDRQIVLDGPYQYDRKPDGSMKATWTKKVTLNGNTTEQVFRSTYLPPALFQPKPQASTPNPETEQTPANTPVPNPVPDPVPPPPPTT